MAAVPHQPSLPGDADDGDRRRSHRPVSMSPRDAAFLLTCLRVIGEGAPCQARIEAVIASVGGTDRGQGECRIPATVFARGLSMAAVVWAIDSGLVGAEERDLAQGVLEHLWQLGPVRPELIGAQLRCLVGQDPGERHCLWTCPAMRRANVGFALPDGSITRARRPDLAWAASEAAVELAPAPDDCGGGVMPSWAPRRGARIRCRECARLGIVLGVDPEDGWTVIEHHAPLGQRADGLWEVLPSRDAGPRQCRYLTRREDVRVG